MRLRQLWDSAADTFGCGGARGYCYVVYSRNIGSRRLLGQWNAVLSDGLVDRYLWCRLCALGCRGGHRDCYSGSRGKHFLWRYSVGVDLDVRSGFVRTDDSGTLL